MHLTASRDIAYAQELADGIGRMNGEMICFEGQEIPLALHTGITKFEGRHLKYDELFVWLHQAILDNK